MPEQRYWDACVFLSYINEYAGRMPILDALFDEAKEGRFEIVTSTLSIVEVAYGLIEQKSGSLAPEIEERISQLWKPGSPVKLAEFYRHIAEDARDLIRTSVSRSWTGLKPADAIHLATARRLGVAEANTYDPIWSRYAAEW